MCTSLAPRPMTVVFGLGTRLRVLMRTTLKIAPYATDSSRGQCCELSTRGAIKTLSGHIAPRCDKHQFSAKMTVSTGTVFELSLFEQSGRNELRKKKGRTKTKNFTFATAHFCV